MDPTEKRKPRALSPSALKMFKTRTEEYYRKYITPIKPPPFEQTEPMSVGSAFDASVKAYIREKVDGVPFKETYEYFFEQGVDPHNRDFARKAGDVCFNLYKETGALASLMLHIERADGDILMEESLSVAFYNTARGAAAQKLPADRDLWPEAIAAPLAADESAVLLVVLNGKPDLLFSVDGIMAILDWKVNGYCSKTRKSPEAGYIACWDPDKGGKPAVHKRAHVQPFDRQVCQVPVNIELDGCLPSDWDLQTSTYKWLMSGEAPTTQSRPYIKMIDQICGGGNQGGSMRVARHAYRSVPVNDLRYFADYCDLWQAIADGKVLEDDRQAAIDAESAAFITDEEQGSTLLSKRAAALGLDADLSEKLSTVNMDAEKHFTKADRKAAL